MAGPNDFTGQNIQDTYQRVLQISSSGVITDGTGSIIQLNSSSIQTATTASHALFAVSASHEITFELSSSHAVNADTASFATNFTASGDISASGEFIGAHPILIGDTLIDGGDLTIGQAGSISSGGGHVKLRLNAPGTGYEDIILFDKGNVNKWIMGSKAGQNEFMIAKEATTLSGTDPVFSLGTSGDITASGDISSSGNLIGIIDGGSF